MTAIYAAAAYPYLVDSLAQKLVDFDSDTFKAALFSAYTYSATHQFYADALAAGTQSSGTGYTSGGAALTGVTWTKAAGTRANSTAYSVGQIATPGNGHWYMVTTAGTTGGSAPTWPTTDGGTVTDGTVTWTQMGRGNHVWQFKATGLPDWDATGGSLAGKFVIFYDSTPGSDATRPLVGYWDLANNTTQTATNDHFTLTQNAAGIVTLAVI